MGDTDLSQVGEHSGIDFIFCTDHATDKVQYRAERHTKTPLVVPLIWTVIDIQYDLRPRLASHFGSEKGCAAAWLFAQASSSYQQGMTVSKRRRQYIINSKLDISTVITVVYERETIWRLDT